MKTDKITWIFFIIILIGIIGGVFHILRLNIFITKPTTSKIVKVVQKPTFTPVRSQRTEVRGQKLEVRSQKSEVRGQKSEVRGQKSESSVQKLISPTLAPQSPHPNPRLSTPQPQTPNSKPRPPKSVIKSKLEPTTGGLLVKSNPQGAIVYLNGEEKGKTPLNIPGLKPWIPYQLQISLSKYYDWKATIFVEPGEEVKVEANLKVMQEGFIYVTSIPAASAVYLDDELIGQTPLREWKLKPGDYTLKIIHEGYLAQTKRITVSPNEGVFINFEL